MYPAGDLFTDRAGISTLFYIITQTDRICKNGTQYLQGVNRNVTDTAFLQRPCERRNTLLEKCRIFDVKIHMPAYAKEYAFETVGTDNTYVKKIQSFGIGGTIRGSGLAFVHDKERVLTSQQNSLFEKVVSKLPNLLKISDMFRRTDVVNSRISGVNNNNNTSSDKITINKVECVFPNATNSTEIQKAILGLPRLAIQK